MHPWGKLLLVLLLALALGCTRYARMRRAAESGDPQRMYEFAVYLWEERPVNFYKDGDESIYWLSKAAEKGNTMAMRYLGSIYELGNTDVLRSVYWYKMAADGGDRPSMNQLANAYRFGQLGLPRDEVKADYWDKRFKEAGEEEQWGPTKKKAQEGDAGAMLTLGRRAETLHSEAGDREALGWYSKAAEAGDKEARMMLSNAYGHGELGLQKDPVKSNFWFQKWQESMRAEQKR